MDDDSDPPSDLEPSSTPPPPSFMCPIGHEIMRDPVSCADSHSYERAHIERWLVSNSTSLLTGAVLPTKVVTSNHALRNLIQERQEESRCVVEVDENTPPPPGGSNSSNAQPKWRITRGSGGGKKKRTAEPEFDYDDYDSVIDCIDSYKADIADMETRVTQLKEQGKTMKQRHENAMETAKQKIFKLQSSLEVWKMKSSDVVELKRRLTSEKNRARLRLCRGRRRRPNVATERFLKESVVIISL